MAAGKFAILVVFVLTTSGTVSGAGSSSSASAADHGFGRLPLPLHLLKTKDMVSGEDLPESKASCVSWRFGVETNNLRGWSTVPGYCEKYIGHYMLGKLYRMDSATVVGAAIDYLATVVPGGEGKEVWVFDIDETTLSNLPYYATHGFGTTPYDPKAFSEWVMTGLAPPLPETLKLYQKVISLGLKAVFITGRPESQRDITVENFHRAGITTWEKLILKGPDVKGTAAAYKTKARQGLVDEGYVIVGNIGDQWSDILGDPAGNRTFKLPDPMYYIA